MKSPPFLRQGSRAVAPIISTILMVAITVVLAAVVFVMVSGMLVKPPAPPPAVSLGSGDWDNGTYTTSVVAVTGVGEIPASGLTYILEDAGGERFYIGAADQNNTVNSVTVSIHFRDRDGGDRITPGDQLVIVVQPISGRALVEGGVLQVLSEGRQIANHGV